jgi:hypothetical protein
MSNEIEWYQVISLIKFILRFVSLTMVNIKFTVFWDYHVVWWMGTHSLEEPAVSIIRVAEMSSKEKLYVIKDVLGWGSEHSDGSTYSWKGGSNTVVEGYYMKWEL